jgi:hypothetical protein
VTAGESAGRITDADLIPSFLRRFKEIAMSKGDWQGSCKLARLNFIGCSLTATVIGFSRVILRNIEKAMQFLAFNQSSAWDFSFNSPDLAKGVNK